MAAIEDGGLPTPVHIDALGELKTDCELMLDAVLLQHIILPQVQWWPGILHHWLLLELLLSRGFAFIASLAFVIDLVAPEAATDAAATAAAALAAPTLAKLLLLLRQLLRSDANDCGFLGIGDSAPPLYALTGPMPRFLCSWTEQLQQWTALWGSLTSTRGRHRSGRGWGNLIPPHPPGWPPCWLTSLTALCLPWRRSCCGAAYHLNWCKWQFPPTTGGRPTGHLALAANPPTHQHLPQP